MAIETADKITPGVVRDSLYRIKKFKGVTGYISFDSYGNVEKPIVILQFLNGKTQYLKTIQP